EWTRMEGCLSERGQTSRSVQPNLRPARLLGAVPGWITFGSNDRLKGRDKVRGGKAVGDHPAHRATGILHPDDGANADGRRLGSPEVELVRRGRLELGGHN